MFNVQLKCKHDEKNLGKEVNLWKLKGVCILMNIDE